MTDKDKNHSTNPTDVKIKKILAEQIGVEPEDIQDEDSFVDELHMRPTDIADFLETLSQNEIDITDIDMTSIGSVGELLELLSSDEDL